MEGEFVPPLYDTIEAESRSVPVDSDIVMTETNVCYDPVRGVPVDNDIVMTEANVCYNPVRAVPVDNDIVMTEANVFHSNPGVFPARTAAINISTAHTTCQIAGKKIQLKKLCKDVNYKRFICILVTITLVTLISLACLVILFIEAEKLKSSHDHQLTSSSTQIDSNHLHNTMIDMQLSTLHNQTQQLSDSNTMLQQQLHN